MSLKLNTKPATYVRMGLRRSRVGAYSTIEQTIE